MNCCRHYSRKCQEGFGLLEALVALVLISSVGFALLAWVHQNLDATFRMREFYAEQEARRYALEWMRTVNPMQEPEGEVVHGDYKIAWKAKQLGVAIPQVGYPQGIGRHEVALFQARVTVMQPQGPNPWIVQEITLIGSQRSGAAPAAPLQ